MGLRKLAATFGYRQGCVAWQGAATGAEVQRAYLLRAFSSVVDGLKYAESHEWVKVEGNVATVGISDHAQNELGDVVYVELPEVGKDLKAAETFGVVESVKAASDVYMPVSGQVVEVNEELNDSPGKVNTGPYTDGWIVKVQLSDPSEVDKLMSSDAYSKHTSG